jgi:hypothetical protein
MRIAPLLLGALLLAATPVSSQPAPPVGPGAAASDTDARLAAARRMMETTGAMALAAQLIDALEGQLVAALSQANPGREAQVRQVVTELLLPEFRTRVGELEAPILRIWADAFTAAEMEEIIAFYATPAGRKTLSVMPQLSQQSGMLGMAWGQRVAQEAFAKHERALRERGIRI